MLKENLLGGDLRSISKVSEIVKTVDNQQSFDKLVVFLSSSDRLLQMRSIDAIEKITVNYPEFLIPHKNTFLELSKQKQTIEFKWHLAQLLPRLPLNQAELTQLFETLKNWALTTTESKIVRVNSIQALYDITSKLLDKQEEFQQILTDIQQENIPSLNARIKKLI